MGTERGERKRDMGTERGERKRDMGTKRGVRHGEREEGRERDREGERGRGGEGEQRENLLRETQYSKNCLLPGKPLQLHLQACDVKSKEEKSGPENMLVEPTTGDGRAYR